VQFRLRLNRMAVLIFICLGCGRHGRAPSWPGSITWCWCVVAARRRWMCSWATAQRLQCTVCACSVPF
jgi:hypothetical protein